MSRIVKSPVELLVVRVLSGFGLFSTPSALPWLPFGSPLKSGTRPAATSTC
jgi:hypothetical protein